LPSTHQSVGIIILGAGGYMGRNGIEALAPLRDRLLKSNIAIKFLCLAEPEDDKRKAAIELCQECLNHPLLEANRLTEALQRLDGARTEESYPVLIYDATPTTFHHGHLVAVHQRTDDTLFYLGEKPVLTDPKEIDHITLNFDEEFLFFCEFIETENPVFHAVRSYLTANPDLRVQDIWSWRAGCSGIKKAISIGRLGVEGGALEDKCLHDLSITVGVLGVPNIKGAEVTAAQVHSLILHRDYYFNEGETTFLTVCNHSTNSERLEREKSEGITLPSDQLIVEMDDQDAWPADGLLSMDISWNLKDGPPVRSKYLFSWVGFNELEQEAEFVDLMKNLGFPLDPSMDEFPDLDQTPRQWLDVSETHTYESDTHRYEAILKEIRITVLKCEWQGISKYIVCNFLAKYTSKRFAYVVEFIDGHPTVTDRLFVELDPASYNENKKNDLASILHNVVMQAFGHSRAELIDRHATLLTHDTMIRARERAYKDLRKDVSYWLPIAEDLFRKNIKVTSLKQAP
jgi:hypothetical protein